MLFVIPAVLLPPDGYKQQIEVEKKEGYYFTHLHLLTWFCLSSRPEGGGYPRNYDKTVRQQG